MGICATKQNTQTNDKEDDGKLDTTCEMEKKVHVAEKIEKEKIVKEKIEKKTAEKDKNLILVHVTDHLKKKFDPFDISISYSDSTTVGDLLNSIILSINKKYYPKIHRMWCIEKESFTMQEYWSHWSTWETIYSTPINKYSREKIENKGLNIWVKVEYEHKVSGNQITCQYMKQKTSGLSKDRLHCPIYAAMKTKYQFSENHLNHLLEFVHFEDAYSEKQSCKYNQSCKSFIRLENGGNRLVDRCHVQLFRHPPRNNRQIKLSQNINNFSVNTMWNQKTDLYEATDEDKNRYQYNETNGFLRALIEEVIANGFEKDLCLTDEDYKNKTYSLMHVVENKLNHFRHRQIGLPLNKGHMLALVLYTGCDCNYDLCATQRQGNYKKWKWFDYCLYFAIDQLSLHETGKYKLYSGLNNVKLKQKSLMYGSFPTYVSTSWREEVSRTFVGDEGMLIEIDDKFRGDDGTGCCDVSWISKFPDECEILITRKHGYTYDDFRLNVVDEINGLQIVSLKQMRNSNDD